ncbi:POLYOL/MONOSACCHARIDE TRANSPORTER 1 [Salix koriyanagi]|uniref:POLYOL/MONOSACCHARIDE TRANSPORTER 1 n=1 Tax=Salix koriyanagi TaxID=2511006 RepID=A0A9Q0ZKR5_9ROSI|nr:POLYOL/MONOSACCHARIDE TRANSPORTER 1 [Salix koriyanagi]
MLIAGCGIQCFQQITGIGPVCWVLSSEIYPSKASSSSIGSRGGGQSVISALSVAFVHTCVPETKGKSLEQIEMMFQNGGELQSGEVELGDVEVQRLVQKE